ncbi:MAG: hypothetical protein R3F14_04725 [Polyangiaceae bacterium]
MRPAFTSGEVAKMARAASTILALHDDDDAGHVRRKYQLRTTPDL